jgi:hypothetical protein
MRSIQPRPLLLLGVGNNSIDNSSDNDSDASERTTCTTTPPSKQLELPVPPTSKTILPEPEELMQPALAANTANTDAHDDDAKDSQDIGESEDGTSFEVSISGIHADSNNDSNNNQASTDDVTTSNALVPPPTLVTKSKVKDRHPKTKRSVGFEAYSTLYVFNDDSDGEEERYDVRNTWYSVQDLKSFRADAFLTVNWIVVKGIDPSCGTEEQPHDSKSQNQLPHKSEYSYYSKKYGIDRNKEVEKINAATKKGYEFCERGVECRTPLGRIAKNKRRLDALRVVLLYQQMQRQHRRERRRELRRQKQRQNRSNETKIPQSCIRHPTTPDPEAARRIEANIDAEALANVYGTYCEESLSMAFAMGQADATFAGTSTAEYVADDDTDDASSSVTGQEAPLLVHPCESSCKELSPASNDLTSTTLSAPNHFTKSEIVNCPSLCDKDDDDDDDDEDFMDNLITLSFVDHSDDDESDEDSSISSEGSLSLDPTGTIFDSRRSSHSEGSLIRGTADDNDSFGSDFSVSLGAMYFEQNKRNSQLELSESEIEVELIEGNDEYPHKISCYSERPSSTNHLHRKNLLRRNSWAHQDQKSKSGLSSLEFGGLLSAAAFWRR